MIKPVDVDQKATYIGMGMLRNREVLLKLIQFARNAEYRNLGLFNRRAVLARVEQLNALADDLLRLDEISTLPGAQDKEQT